MAENGTANGLNGDGRATSPESDEHSLGPSLSEQNPGNGTTNGLNGDGRATSPGSDEHSLGSTMPEQNPGNSTASGPNGTGQATSPGSNEHSLPVGSTMPEQNPGNGMAPDVLPMYGVSDGVGGYLWQPELPQGCPDPSEDADTGMWAIIIRRLRNRTPHGPPFYVDSITIQSPLLKELLGQVLQGYPGFTPNLSRLQLQGRCEPLIHRWHALEKAITSMEGLLENGNDDVQLHDRIKHATLFNNFLKAEFADERMAMTDCMTNGVVYFQFLWVIFEPGSLLFTRSGDQDVAVFLESTKSVMIDKIPCFELTCSLVDFDGNRLGVRTLVSHIKTFDQTKRIVDLPIFPLEYHTRRHQICAKLIERGRRFESLAGVHYRHYDGMASQLSRNGLNGRVDYYPLNGRVVIDALTFNMAYPTQAANCTLTNDLDSIHINRITRVPLFEGDENDASGTSVHDLGGNMPEDGQTASGHDQKHPKLTEDQMLVCWPFIRGYALKEKKWLSLSVDSISDIAFNDLAFSDLCLPQEQKQLMIGLASSHESYWNSSQDPAQGKGRGVLVLLRGPPGVGKTLTAESVAEKMKAPLFTLTSGDFAKDETKIEGQLVDLISMCGRWGAIILLDEIDVFFDQINQSKMERNKLVSIFLRVVEHYQGITFLTANQVETFDPAFESRIHISLEYPELDRQCRKAIWQRCLRRHNDAQAVSREKPTPTTAREAKPGNKRALSPPPSGHADSHQAAEELHQRNTQPHDVTDMDVEKLACRKLDGRQIGNCFQTARLMAIHGQQALRYFHIDNVVSMTEHFRKAKEAHDEQYARLYG